MSESFPTRFKPSYSQHNDCAEKDKNLEEYKNIPSDGNCLFASLLTLMNNSMSIDTFKESLLRSAAIKLCSEKAEVKKILSTPKAWGNSEVSYVFSETYDTNVCVHIHNSNDKRVNYAHYEANKKKDFIHSKLKNAHYTPLLPANENKKDIDKIYENDDENFCIEDSNDLSDFRGWPEYVREPEEIPPKPPDKQSNQLLQKNHQTRPLPPIPNK